MLGFRKRRDVRPDPWIHSVVDEGHARGVPDEPESPGT